MLSPVFGAVALANDDGDDEEEAACDEECQEKKEEDQEDVEEAKEEYEDTAEELEKEQERWEAHKRALNSMQSNLNATVAQIQQTEAVIETTEQTIDRKEGEITSLEKRLELQRAVLGNLVQEFYRTSQTSVVGAALVDGGLVKLAQAKDNTVTLGGKMNAIIDDVEATKEKVSQEKVELEDLKKQKEGLLVVKERQAADLKNRVAYQSTKVEKSEETIQSLQEKLSELRSDIARLTGKSYSTEDIREAVEFASDHSRVPESVLYGFLGAETRFNANTGQCTYKQVKKDAINLWYGSSSKWKSSRDLLEKRMDIFYDIVDELGYDKDKKVSCTPRSYRGQGGAMGVSQFMADVWRGYEPSIRSKTGNKQPDPWSLVDGIMAMALKLEKAGATSESKSRVKAASISYLGAFNQGYYNNILYWMENYEDAFN